GRVEPGFPVQLVVDAHGDRRFDGQVLAVEPVVDPATRNFTVRARLPNPDGLLSGGQFARVTLLLPGAESVLAVPRTAIDYSSYGASVYVVQPRSGATAGELEVIQRFVRLGEARGDFVAVAEGLKPDERVATSGLLKLRNQQPVSIDNSNPPQPSLSPSLPNT
ncbi:MAG TPA: efflux RND transporter periplasmic adaptor subunit, partial [Nevskiaceae bacterium]|nr:efflux RND transporter periplasmic adaptor subunit [Nevskiaceae bacterium]